MTEPIKNSPPRVFQVRLNSTFPWNEAYVSGCSFEKGITLISAITAQVIGCMKPEWYSPDLWKIEFDRINNEIEKGWVTWESSLEEVNTGIAPDDFMIEKECPFKDAK